jgi:pimeloyl-ACP methyl ester carboxylesterase
MSPNPTLIFVAGAWHSIETWDKVISILKPHYKCTPVTLPSTLGDAEASLEDDINAVRDAISSETQLAHDVVVVVHSYGGAVGQSAIKGLTTKENTNGVIGLVMMASGFGQTGVSFIDGLGGKPPPSWRLDPSGFAILVAPSRELFYHDLPEEEGEYWVSKLQKQALKPMMEGGEHAYAGWMDLPVWFLITTEDKALPVQAQRMFVQMAKDLGGDITVREVDSSHSPMLSKPTETANFILEAAKSLAE